MPGSVSDHRQNHGLRQFDPHGFAVEELDLDLQDSDVRYSTASPSVSRVRLSLLVVLGVHEVVVVAVAVEKLHIRLRPP